MSLFGVELDDILKGRPDRGHQFSRQRSVSRRDTDASAAADEGSAVERIHSGQHGSFRSSEKARQLRRDRHGNYIWFRGASIRFGRLTMSDADLKLIDMDPRDPFDFYSARYNEQLVAGYSKNTPDHALRTYMPDFCRICSAPPLTSREVL